MITITGLFYYPIKGCKGWRLDSANLIERGIAFDRHFMIVNPDGRFLTQREHPRMALIEPTIANGTLTLSAAGMEALSLPHTDEGSTEKVVVWQDTCDAVSQGQEAAEWLSTFLGVDAHLVTMHRDFRRTVDQTYAVRPTDHTGFADGFQMLLASEASLESVNSRLIESGNEPVPMNRFRPNIVVAGCDAFAEDTWKHFNVRNSAGDVEMYGVKLCGRCIVTTVDQASGTKTGAEPIATLKKFRRNADGTKVLFGQNVIHRNTGTIAVGDTIELLG
ncbi:MAG: MOSC N-terminal beta barrel domain-containing protein [Ignavibacteria bacterium]|nr:MOSC N-terminal beta barrel domain-containing protein [Ignavibacteria bacterium]